MPRRHSGGLAVFTSAGKIFRSYPELEELRDHECNRLQKELAHRDRILAALPAVAGFVVFWAWMLFFGKGSDWLERRYDWDLLDLGAGGYILFALLGMPTGAALALLAGYRIWARMLRSAIEAHLKDKRCLWCGYCLTGHESSLGRVRCPECGGLSPVRV